MLMALEAPQEMLVALEAAQKLLVALEAAPWKAMRQEHCSLWTYWSLYVFCQSINLHLLSIYYPILYYLSPFIRADHALHCHASSEKNQINLNI